MKTLYLETLEDRCVPANIAWLGAVSGDMMVSENWQGRLVPGPADTVQLGALAPRCYWPVLAAWQSLDVGQIHLLSTFNGRTLQVDGNLFAAKVLWPFDKILSGTGRLTVGRDGMAWSAGSILVSHLNICNGGRLQALGTPGTLSSNVWVGWADNPLTVSAGFMDLGDENGMLATTTHINLTGTIYTSAQGKVRFHQDREADLGGGIVGAGRIVNNGVVEFYADSTDGHFLRMGVPIRNTGTVTVGLNVAQVVLVEFADPAGGAPSILNTGAGVVRLTGTSHLKLSDRLVMDSTDASVIAGGFNDINGSSGRMGFTIEGEYVQTAGKLSMPGGQPHLIILGNFTLSGGRMELAINADTGGYDHVHIDGVAKITGGTLAILSPAGTPPPGTWDVIDWSSKDAAFTGFGVYDVGPVAYHVSDDKDGLYVKYEVV